MRILWVSVSDTAVTPATCLLNEGEKVPVSYTSWVWEETAAVKGIS